MNSSSDSLDSSVSLASLCGKIGSMRTRNVEAIVLKTYDVGEADRFCVLLTRELGRLAARARGVRKLTSRMGGALLPFQHVHVELKEFGNDGWLVTAATQQLNGLWLMVDGSRTINQSTINQLTSNQLTSHQHLQAFSQAQQGSELLLKLLHDRQPLPEVFDATLQFLRLCAEQNSHIILGFKFHLLHLLGHLPESNNDAYFEQCSQEERNFVTQAREGRYENFVGQEYSCPTNSRLQAIADALIADQISSPLRAGDSIVALHL